MMWVLELCTPHVLGQSQVNTACQVRADSQLLVAEYPPGGVCGRLTEVLGNDFYVCDSIITILCALLFECGRRVCPLPHAPALVVLMQVQAHVMQGCVVQGELEQVFSCTLLDRKSVV
jgi:hypothetical protein